MNRKCKALCAVFLSAALLAGMFNGALCEGSICLVEDVDALRDVDWTWTAEQVADAEGGRVVEGNVRVDDGVKLYALDALRLTYLFDDEGAMTARSFRMPKNQQVHASLLVSLLYRYGAPYFDDGGKTKLWVLDDAVIELSDTNYVFVIYTQRQPAPEADHA